MDNFKTIFLQFSITGRHKLFLNRTWWDFNRVSNSPELSIHAAASAVNGVYVNTLIDYPIEPSKLFTVLDKHTLETANKSFLKWVWKFHLKMYGSQAASFIYSRQYFFYVIVYTISTRSFITSVAGRKSSPQKYGRVNTFSYLSLFLDPVVTDNTNKYTN